ncbi:MAG: hypothetical protein K1X83_05700 [Oligoflexia bacterium]|nr:hypothetical protein [Oligoflexia bacterium]
MLLVLAVVVNGCMEPQPPGAASISQALNLVDQGTLMLREGDLHRAQGSFESSWEIVPSPQALDGQGCVAFLHGEFGAAERYFRRAYSEFEKYPEALANLALLYEATGRRSAADSAYRLALREAPANFRGRNNYAVFLRDSGAGPGKVLKELFKAEAVEKHPMITENISYLEENSDE